MVLHLTYLNIVKQKLYSVKEHYISKQWYTAQRRGVVL